MKKKSIGRFITKRVASPLVSRALVEFYMNAGIRVANLISFSWINLRFDLYSFSSPSSELGYERFKLPVAFFGQELPGVAHEPVGVKLSLLGHEHGFDVADILGPVEDFFEHDQVFGGVNTDRAAFQP
jgi:hypothetical protein